MYQCPGNTPNHWHLRKRELKARVSLSLAAARGTQRPCTLRKGCAMEPALVIVRIESGVGLKAFDVVG